MPGRSAYMVLLCTMLLLTGKGAGAQPAPAGPVYSALVGAWVGTLEYRDYSNNARVVLPTILGVRRTKDGQSLDLHYIYDDGPAKVVQDDETVTIDPVAGTYTTVSGDGKSMDNDILVGLDAFLKSGQGQLVRNGKGVENSKPVDVRTTLTVSARSLVIRKETRPPGGSFLFRDQLTLIRAVPAIISGGPTAQGK